MNDYQNSNDLPPDTKLYAIEVVRLLFEQYPTIKEWKCFWSYDNMLNLLKTGKNIPNQNG